MIYNHLKLSPFQNQARANIWKETLKNFNLFRTIRIRLFSCDYSRVIIMMVIIANNFGIINWYNLEDLTARSGSALGRQWQNRAAPPALCNLASV